MAKSSKRHSRRPSKAAKPDTADYERIDVYLIPKEQASLYRVLREAVIQEVTEWMEQESQLAQVVTGHDEIEGAYIQALYNGEVRRYYFSPTNISQAQKARDKHQLPLYLEREILGANT